MGGGQAAPVYTETHKAFTNTYGSFSLAVGRGKVTKGDFATIDWSSGNHYLQLEMDAAGGDSYKLMGSSELLSVPYAFYAGTAARLGNSNSTGARGAGVSGQSATTSSGVPSNTWSLFGNRSSVPGTDYLGTADMADLIMKTNGVERFVLRATGEIEGRSKMTIDGSITSKISATSGAFYVGGVGYGLQRTGNNNVELFTTGGNLVLSGGKVGIGTATPLSMLSVVGGMGVGAGYASLAAAPTNGAIIEGKVGIGTNAPTEQLQVVGNTLISGTMGIGMDLNVGGTTSLAGDLKVAGSSEFVDIIAKRNATIGNNLTVTNNINGKKITLTNTESGSGSDASTYPVYVNAASNGMAIKVNSSGQGTNSDKNFIGFFDNSGLRGAVEGQNSADYASDPEFITEALYQGFKVAALGVAIAASPFEVADIVWLTADLAYYATIHSLRGANIGVSYSSGSGDYAEWLPRLTPTEAIVAGDIVGVRGGKITKDTRDAQQLLAVSTAPIVLGNMHQPGQEHLSEKVAFMGQIPVKVRGAVLEGDYIIPSGLNDGVGLAITPSSMTAEEYTKVIGRAWASAEGADEKLVNVVVGLNAGDVAKLLQRDASERDALRAMLSLTRALGEKNSQELLLMRSEVSQLHALASQQPGRRVALRRAAAKTARAKAQHNAVTQVAQ